MNIQQKSIEQEQRRDPYRWYWDVFGGGILFVTVPFEVPLWRRVLTRVLLGSVWKRIGK